MRYREEFARQVGNLAIAGYPKEILENRFLAQLLDMLPNPEAEVDQGFLFLIVIPKKVVPLATQLKIAGMIYRELPPEKQGSFKINPMLDLRSEINVSDRATPNTPYLALGIKGHDVEPLQLTWSDLGDYERDRDNNNWKKSKFHDNKEKATYRLRLEEAISQRLHYPTVMPNNVRMCLFGSWLAHQHVFSTSWLPTFVMPGEEPEARWYLDAKDLKEPFPVVLPACEVRLIPEVRNPPWRVIPTRTPAATFEGASFLPGTPMLEEEKQPPNGWLRFFTDFFDKQASSSEKAWNQGEHRLSQIHGIVISEVLAFIRKAAEEKKNWPWANDRDIKFLHSKVEEWQQKKHSFAE